MHTTKLRLPCGKIINLCNNVIQKSITESTESDWEITSLLCNNDDPPCVCVHFVIHKMWITKGVFNSLPHCS